MELFLVEIRASEWARSLAWYVGVLGLPTLLVDDEHQYALLAAGAGRIAIKEGRPSVVPSAIRLTFRVDDVEAERSRLSGLGVEIGPILDNPAEGFQEVRFQDPEGTPITAFAWSHLA